MVFTVVSFVLEAPTDETVGEYKAEPAREIGEDDDEEFDNEEDDELLSGIVTFLIIFQGVFRNYNRIINRQFFSSFSGMLCFDLFFVCLLFLSLFPLSLSRPLSLFLSLPRKITTGRKWKLLLLLLF